MIGTARAAISRHSDETSRRLQPQEMLAANLDMTRPALHLLGGCVDVPHLPLERVAGEDRSGAGLMIGEFGDLLGLLDS